MRTRRFDVTDALAKRSTEPHELLVLATDHTEQNVTPDRNFPVGKQRIKTSSIFYTSSSGAPSACPDIVLCPSGFVGS